MKFDCLDSLLEGTNGLLSIAGKLKGGRYELPAPIMFELTNPMARFSCMADNRELAAKSAAETLYAFSGMNGSDFIWEFRGWEDPRVKKHHDLVAIGSPLRFFGREDNILGYHESNSLRQNGTGFRDQIADAVNTLKQNKNASVVMQIITRKNNSPVFQSWLYCRDDKLNIMVQTGSLDNHSELIFKYVPVFSFILQVMADMTGIAMGSVWFTVGCLLTDKPMPSDNIRSIGYPVVNTGDFRYPSGGVCLRDLDILMAIMVEFVSRLDGNSLSRANPFEGDERVQMWSDYAEIFRAWKAEKLGCKIEMEQNFFHPQLRFIYKGESL